MELLSVNVALPREVTYHGRRYPTAIYKEPVTGRARVRRLNIDGDLQGSPHVHGGPDMAVYVYSVDHFAFWATDLGASGFPYGAFGENLTVTGLGEAEVRIGDVLAIGSTRFQVTEPRTPCHKLAMKFEDDDMPRRMRDSGRVGFYLRVLDEGEIGAGDEIRLEAEDPAGLTVAEVLDLWTDKAAPAAALERAVAVPALSEKWRRRFAARIAAAPRAEVPGAASAPSGDRLRWDPNRLIWM